MEIIYFDKSHVKSKTHIKKHGYIHGNEFRLHSEVTGIEKVFTYDSALSRHKAEMNEFWDGEESHKLYTSKEAPGVIFEMWYTPYDLREM